MPSGLRFFSLIFILEFLVFSFIFYFSPYIIKCTTTFPLHACSLALVDSPIFTWKFIFYIIIYLFMSLVSQHTTTGGPTTLPFPITLSHSITVTDYPHTPGPRFMLSWVHLSIFSITAFSPRTHLAFPPPLSLFLAEIWLFMAKQPPLHLLSMAASPPLPVRTTLCTIDHFSICCHPNAT